MSWDNFKDLCGIIVFLVLINTPLYLWAFVNDVPLTFW
jgi:hypothetical protein